jgi:hypothetical protein
MKVIKVNKVTPVKQTDYLRILGEAMVQVDAKTPHKPNPVLAIRELPIRTYNKGVRDAN